MKRNGGDVERSGGTKKRRPIKKKRRPLKAAILKTPAVKYPHRKATDPVPKVFELLLTDGDDGDIAVTVAAAERPKKNGGRLCIGNPAAAASEICYRNEFLYGASSSLMRL